MSEALILQFRGWCLVRLPTDPDPHDEPRGVSGYSFAFAGEPDLDRVIHLQPPDDIPLRSHGHPIGVHVVEATKIGPAGPAPVAGLEGARVSLLDNPQFQNQNWNLTLPGYEPIVPFHLQIQAADLVIRRQAPLDPDHPDRSFWLIEKSKLAAQGARGIEYEPETVGKATGIWDSLQIAQDRLALLQADLQTLPTDSVAAAALRGRIAQLRLATAAPGDRRIMMRYCVERFGFPLLGVVAIEGDEEGLLGGRLLRQADPKNPWHVDFWFGGWDPDLLSCFLEGSLRIPFEDPPA